MYKMLFISIIISVILMGCNQSAMFEDSPIVIVSKEYSDKVEYDYKYEVTMMFDSRDTMRGAVEQKFTLYSNGNYDLGDTIWIGARWGKGSTKPFTSEE